jgi:regulator of sigma E protease
MGVITQIAGLLLSLSILVILHEFGHFFFARLFKTRVEKFYIFFNPWFSLFKIKKGDTEYGMGWLPLGGYVKISGMIDESLDTEQLSQEPQPYEFRSKPAWQRLLIMLGGVLVNFILALIIYSGILFVWGDEYLPARNVSTGFHFDPIAQQAGFENGDRIYAVGDSVVEDYADIVPLLVLEKPAHVTVVRNGEKLILPISPDFPKQIIAQNVKDLIFPRIPFYVDSVLAGSPAESGGLKKGDRIIGLNDTTTLYFQDFDREKKRHAGQEVAVIVLRNGEAKTLKVNLDQNAWMGIANQPPDKYFKTNSIQYGFFESIPAGILKGVNTLGFYVKQMKLVFSKEGARQIGGFGAIGGLFPKAWDWERFWNMTAFLSIILAFMNILPIPALDGGHVAFLMYEIISGRKPSDKFMEYAQMTGMILLFGLLIFANGNDIWRWIQSF